MKKEVIKFREYLNVALSTTKFEVDIVEKAASAMMDALDDCLQGDICPRCTYLVLGDIKKDCDQLVDALTIKYGKERTMLQAISDAMGTLMRGYEEGGYDLSHCGTYMAVNN
jgi:hypothetical protein